MCTYPAHATLVHTPQCKLSEVSPSPLETNLEPQGLCYHVDVEGWDVVRGKQAFNEVVGGLNMEMSCHVDEAIVLRDESLS